MAVALTLAACFSDSDDISPKHNAMDDSKLSCDARSTFWPCFCLFFNQNKKNANLTLGVVSRYIREEINDN